MAVIIKYIVERNGEEKMTFTSKAEADAYDRMLDIADDIFTLLESSSLIKDEVQCEELSLYLAQHKEDMLTALGAKRKTSQSKPKTKKNDSDASALEDNSHDDNENAAA